MKIMTSCHTCMVERIAQNANISTTELFESADLHYVDVRPPEEGYEWSCPKGHKVALTMGMTLYELLFEAGCLALLRGAYRDAVSSFAAANERFLEFYALVVARRYVDLAQVREAWKHCADASERQFGAFVLAHLIATGRSHATTKDENNWRHFRNGVIHKGKFPKRQETRDYAEHVFDFVRTHAAELRKNYANEFDEVRSAPQLEAALSLHKKGHRNVSGGFIVTVLHRDDTDFAGALEVLREANPWVAPGEMFTLRELADRSTIPLDVLIDRIQQAMISLAEDDSKGSSSGEAD